MKQNGGFVYHNLLDKRKRTKPKFQFHNLVCTADLKTTFSRGETTNRSYKFNESTEIVKDTTPSYKVDQLLQRYNEASLAKMQLTLKTKQSSCENFKHEDHREILGLLYNPRTKSKILCPSLLIETNLLVTTKAYPFISLKTFPSNLISPLIAREAVKFC